ncbi:helix-turn-helix domain-containing protein [Planobispora siamensis]|uniref:Transcriptional regulator n=1 Tax=Planobispora siamensis TaxID=936338 RepID=A0A8J3SDY7_9ACTN|nr:helix-turn-helix transcriptional regulator [Planobispora siamensis]GIH92632.1 transcriptional regulator [Planobispora siamensis]
MTRCSPTARHRRLMAELNRLRCDSGLSRAEVAALIGSTDTTLWRYETGLTRPKPSDVAALTSVYGVDGEERESLLQMAKEARRRGWWHRHRRALKPGFDSYIGLEAEASAVRVYEPLVVPGLTQTEAYARAVIEAVAPACSPAEIDEKVAVRASRQRLLHGPGDPIHLVAVLDEAVLWRQVGGREVMREQLEHLVRLGALPNVELRVIPFSAGAHAAMDGKFCLLRLPEAADPDLVYLERATRGLVSDDPEEARRYTRMFDDLTALALDEQASTARIARAAEEMT